MLVFRCKRLGIRVYNEECHGSSSANLSFAFHRSKCNCDAPCQETSYQRDTSISYWPSDHSQTTFYRQHVLEHPEYKTLKAYTNLRHFNVTQLVQHDLIRKNFLRLNVYVESLIGEKIIQKPSYTFFNLFSNIGGTFGLWIGMSVLTWGEVVEFSLQLLIRWANKLSCGRTSLHDKVKVQTAATVAVLRDYVQRTSNTDTGSTSNDASTSQHMV